MIIRQRGDKYRPIVTIIKVKRGVPTVIQVGGHRYILDPITKIKEAERK